MSERTRRVDHLLQEEISAIIRREVGDPRVGFVTITGVEVTPDLRHATVWASVIGDPDERKASLAALGRAMPYVRHHLGALHLKRIPELHLREDDSAQRGTRVMQLLEQIEAEEDGAGATPDAIERPALPTPTAERPDEGSHPDEPVERGRRPARRRRVDRVALKKARQRRGR